MVYLQSERKEYNHFKSILSSNVNNHKNYKFTKYSTQLSDFKQNSVDFFEKVKNILFKPNQQKLQTIDKAKTLLKDGIRVKLGPAHNGLTDEKITCIFNRLLRFNNINENDLNEVATALKVMKLIDNLDSYGNVPLFDESILDFVKGEDAKNLIKLVFSGQPLSSKMVNLNIVKSLLVKKNPELLKDVRKELQNYLNNLGANLNKPEYNKDADQKQAEVLIGNIIALYPFFEPEDNSVLKLPQKIGDRWVMVDYDLKLLQMTPSWKGDPYYACGLTPKNEPNATPHLSFMGTPPPTTRGVAHAEFTDFVPGLAVGETLYDEGKNVIEQWAESTKRATGKKVNVYGQSLGGALAQMLVVNKPECVGKVFAYNPPSLSSSLLKEYRTNVEKLSETERPEVNIFCQENDPVYSIGAGWDTEWNVYHVLPEKSTSAYEAHIAAFSGRKNVVMLKLTKDDIQSHNTSLSRRAYSVFMECLKVPLFVTKGIALGGQILKHKITSIKIR